MELLYTAHVPAGDGPFPAIIALHGWGASAHDLIGLAPIFDGGRSVVLCPQGPLAFQAGPGQVGYGWFPFTGGDGVDPAEFEKGVASLQRFLDEALPTLPVDPRKTAILGFSQGGVMAYALALRDPVRYAGLVALSSWLPSDKAASVAPNPELANLKTLVIHGTRDPMISIDHGRESRDELIKLGVPTTYREYEMGHEINPEALRQLVGWLDETVVHPVLVA
ncbi:MAG: phospholipase [Deltaproteobacteria bacterium]|jgi:phospholipase/carboxylesterase|nr:phospholipase [Deltaproteobacteria bacterium]